MIKFFYQIVTRKVYKNNNSKKGDERMSFWGWFRIITGTLIVTTVGIIVLVKWHKEIDSETTWIYGIYVILNIILSLFLLIELEQYWLMK